MNELYNAEGYRDPVPYQAVYKKEKAWKPLVYIASPYSGDVEANREAAVRYCRFAYETGAIPVAPHLLFPLFLSEETEREEALFMDMVVLGRCEQLWVFGSRITAGMGAEIEKAVKKKMRIRYFTEDCREV